jgi:Protein of unknown function (DUF3431)
MNIVVARYNEDVEWTKQFKNVIIYNKGEPLPDSYETVIPLKNVGREGHTYYQYIYENYDNLAEYTVFLQGNPFDHSPNIIDQVEEFQSKKDLNVNFLFLTKLILTITLDHCPYHPGPLPISDVYEKLFDIKRKDSKIIRFKFGAGAQFIVSKATILKRPRSFYLKIIELLNYDKNPIEGFVIERFHGLIFE